MAVWKVKRERWVEKMLAYRRGRLAAPAPGGGRVKNLLPLKEREEYDGALRKAAASTVARGSRREKSKPAPFENPRVRHPAETAPIKNCLSRRRLDSLGS
jgi:hypothetical protein